MAASTWPFPPEVDCVLLTLKIRAMLFCIINFFEYSILWPEMLIEISKHSELTGLAHLNLINPFKTSFRWA